MQTALVSVPLGSTPPQHTPTRAVRRGSGGTVVAFRDDQSTGSLPRSSANPSSYVESGSWKSSVAPHSTSTASTVGRIVHARSIPKSESFVKVEGFEAKADSPKSSPPSSPSMNRASSLLSRQLSADSLGLHRPGSSSSSSLAQRLEAQCNGALTLEPKPRPASLPRRPPTPDSLLPRLQSLYPVFSEALVVRSFNISRLAHDGRSDGPNGEPAFSRCVGAASILAEIGADEVAVAGALLHDALDRTMLLEGQLRPMLGSEETIDLVKKVSHLGYVFHRYRTANNTMASDPGSGTAAHLVNLLVAHGPARALLVRLAVALHEARALDSRAGSSSPPTEARIADRRRAATEAIDVWAPLANRLGVWSLKAELEDRAFRSLHPAAYAELRDRLERMQQPTQLVALVDTLRGQLQAAGIDYLDLSGRPKHLWGVWKKMQTKGYSADGVKDVRGLRIIVKTREECYKALRAVEKAWHVPGGQVKNYIKDPKANGYQSLHAVADPGDGNLVEIQIRTDKMHYLAEYGAEAAHWRYKDHASGNSNSSNDAREANWAKYMTSQHVARDKKCRPSGSPSEDQSLTNIMATMDDVPNKSSTPTGGDTDGSGTSPGKGRTFHEYIAATGQKPAPPEEARTLVAVVAGGAFSVAVLEAGTTVAQLLRSCGSDLHTRGIHIVVNRHVETDYAAVLAPGDVVELYIDHQPPEIRPSRPAVPATFNQVNMVPLNLNGLSMVEDLRATAASTSTAAATPQGNMMPLGGLTRRLASTAN